ncbi:MAG TPA: hypothetical protein VM261_05675 [Kofleriaceae bacterium]|nr:hypothetical protein [Kofleriaceae bacterium]
MGDTPAVPELPQPPPRLPATEGDLDAWHTYAEVLRDGGDPRGSLMLLDLSLPALVDRQQVRTLNHACHRLCRIRPATPATWSLAHARDLAIYPSSGLPWRVAGCSPEHGTFANAHDFLRSAPGSEAARAARRGSGSSTTASTPSTSTPCT